MYFYLVAFGLLAHVLFWGAGLALAVMPGRWRNFWPVLVVPAGLTLQALVVWVAVWLGLNGTNSYAWASELFPAAVLAASRPAMPAPTTTMRRLCCAAMLGVSSS